MIYDSKVIHADETPTKVMRIENTKIKNGKKTYMWVYRNRPLRDTHPIVLFDWQPSRRSDHPREFLKDFKDLGFLDELLPWSERVQKECPSRFKKS